jgi:branched-chain amino acid transport system substrate-binding protein
MKRLFSLALVIAVLAVLVPVASAAPRAQGEEYIVLAGDWLSKLADKYLGDPMAYPAIVLATNKKNAEDATFAYIDNPDLIEPGWKLWVPSAEEATALMAAPEGTTYKIGFAPSVTGGGSFLGTPERDTAEIVTAQLESTGGIVGSDGVLHPVEIIMGDTESNPDVGVSLARRFIDENEVVVLVMGSLTPISLAIAEVAEEAEVPYVSMASSSLIIQDPADATKMRYWVFKTPQSNGDVAVWQVKRLQKMGVTSVCYLYENTGYGKDCFNSSMKALEAAGFTTASSDSFERTDTEFPQVAGVQASGCEVVVVGAIPPGAAMVTIAVRDALPDIPIIHGHGVCTEDFITTAGAAAEGVELPCSAVIIAEDLASDHPQKAVFMHYKTLYTDYTGEPVSTFGGHGWDGLMWVLDALKSLPDGLTLDEQRVAVRDYLENNIKDWPGTAGVFTLSPTDHYGLTVESFTWFKVEGGKWAPFPEEQW